MLWYGTCRRTLRRPVHRVPLPRRRPRRRAGTSGCPVAHKQTTRLWALLLGQSSGDSDSNSKYTWKSETMSVWQGSAWKTTRLLCGRQSQRPPFVAKRPHRNGCGLRQQSFCWDRQRLNAPWLPGRAEPTTQYGSRSIDMLAASSEAAAVEEMDCRTKQLSLARNAMGSRGHVF